MRDWMDAALAALVARFLSLNLTQKLTVLRYSDIGCTHCRFNLRDN